MLKIMSLILVFAFSSKALADCQPVTPLVTGEKAPCAGFLFSPEKELQLRIMNEDYKYLKEEVNLYIQQKELYKQELDDTQKIADKEAQKAELWRKAAEDSTKKYVEVQEARTMRDWLFLVAGVGLTVAAGWSLGQAAGHK